MTLSLWLAFATASVVMGLTPGPGVTAIVGYALGSGRKTALPASRLRRLLSRRITTAIATGTAPNDGEKKWRIFVK